MTRLLGYRERPVPVNRAAAEQMAADLLYGSMLTYRLEQDGMLYRWLTVHTAPTGRHRECLIAGEAYPTYLYINRRTGRFRLGGRLGRAELADCR